MPSTPDQSQVSAQSANRVLQGILRSEKTQDLWTRYHRSERNENPAIDVADQLEELQDSFRQNPQLMKFLQELVAIQRRSAKRTLFNRLSNDNSSQKSILHEQLKGLEDYLYLQSLDTKEKVVLTQGIKEFGQATVKNVKITAEYLDYAIVPRKTIKWGYKNLVPRPFKKIASHVGNAIPTVDFHVPEKYAIKIDQALEDFRQNESVQWTKKNVNKIQWNRRQRPTRDQQRLLNVMKHHSAQNRFGLYTVYATAKNLVHHIGHEITEDKKQFRASVRAFSVGAAFVWFMFSDLDPGQTNYIDPTIYASQENLFDSFGDDEVIQNKVDPGALDFIMNKTDDVCHSHIKKNLFGKPIKWGFMSEETADKYASNTLLQAVFPQHCQRVKDLALRATKNMQDDLWGGYDWVNIRMDEAVKNPAMVLAALLENNPDLKEAYVKGAESEADTIYKANTFENIFFHGLLLVMMHMAAKGATGKNREELLEHLNEAWDFVLQTWKNQPLTYAATAAATTAYIAANGVGPTMVWAGIAGLSFGEVFHRVARYTKKLDLAKNTTIDVQKELEIFTHQNYILTGNHTAEDLKGKPSDIQLKFQKRAIESLLTVGFTAAAAYDIMQNGGMGVAEFAGARVVDGLFIGYNVPEDTVWHLGFGGAGTATGLMHGGSVRAINSASQRIKDVFKDQKDQAVIIPRNDPESFDLIEKPLTGEANKHVSCILADKGVCQNPPPVPENQHVP